MKRLSPREIGAQAVPVGDEDYKQLLELAEQRPCCMSVVAVSSEPGDYRLLPGNNALTRGYMLLGPGEVLFEHFAHTAALHESSGADERRRREREGW